MLSKVIHSLFKTTPYTIKGVVACAIPQYSVVVRGYRNRGFQRMESEPLEMGIPDILTSSMGSTPDLESLNRHDNDDIKMKEQSMMEINENKEDFSMGHDEVLFDTNTISIASENVNEMNFEDEFFKITDKMNRKYIEDDINDTLEKEMPERQEPVTFVQGESAKEFYDSIMSLDDNVIFNEKRMKPLSLAKAVIEEQETVEKESTWFNFMPAKEIPEGLFETYSPDQIYSSLEFDLLSRNIMEVYKYEKDDMLLTESVLRHAKMPEPIAAPSIPLYPKFEEYAKWVTFAVNRNGDYSQQDKKKVVDILSRLGSLDSEIDESPKSEFKIKKYL